MIESPTFLVSPSFVKRGDEPEIATDRPLDYAIAHGKPGDTYQLLPGRFHRAGPFNGRTGISIAGYDAPFQSVIARDETVGSTDALILGPGDGKIKFVNVTFEADDRSALKTTSGVGPGVMLVDCVLAGHGNAFDANWNDNTKWGAHCYDSALWMEANNAMFAIRGEHARYFHGIKGSHVIQGGVTAHCGRTAIQVVNRMNEGAEGVGGISITGHSVEDVCLEQGGGGSAFTFRGGMPTSNIFLEGNKIRLGCKKQLALPFQANIAGALLCDSSPESKPGAGDAAWPGGTASINLNHEDYEIGTVYPGKGSAIRPAVKIDSVKRFTMRNTRIVVHRPAGAYVEALEIGNDVGEVQISGENEILGMVTYKGVRYLTFEVFKQAHPECFA